MRQQRILSGHNFESKIRRSKSFKCNYFCSKRFVHEYTSVHTVCRSRIKMIAGSDVSKSWRGTIYWSESWTDNY